MNTLELINSWSKFSDEDKALLSLAICSRGRYKGYLLANKPSDRAKGAVWEAFMLSIAPARATMFGAFGDSESFGAADDLITADFKMCVNAVEPNFRWNLFDHRYDSAKVLAIYTKEGYIAPLETINA